MSTAVERIKNEIRSLAPEEVDELLRDLQSEYVFPPQDVEEASVQAEWDAEIDRRMQEVIEGKVELISGSEVRRGVNELFAQIGLKRPA